MKFSFIIFSGFLLTSCSPKIYVIDQPTIMEMESAGSWPDFEKQLFSAETQPGPVPYPKEKLSLEKKKNLSTLIGESYKTK